MFRPHTGPSGSYLWVSPSCETITGFSASEFLSDPGLFRRIVFPDDLAIIRNHFHESMESDHWIPHTLNFRIVTRDGQVRWISHACRPVLNSDGTFGGRRSSYKDITDRVDAEEALRLSEERFRNIYDRAPVMMHSIDESGTIRNVNGRWLEVMGYDREEVVGNRIGRFMNQESMDRAVSSILPMFWQHGKVKDVSYKYITKDGSILDVLLDSVVMEDPEWGKISLSIVRNITLRKRAEEELRNTKTLLDLIIRNLPTPIFLKDAGNLSYLLWNRASELLYGHSKEEVIGKTASHFFPDDQVERFVSQDREILASGELLFIPEQLVATKEHGIRILQSKKLPIMGEDGKPRYILGISEDITERKLAENALIEAREAAERASKAKSDFLANMSHEIRTPMNGVIGMTELALNTDLTSEQREYLEAVSMSAHSLLTLINDILDFSKMEAGKFELVAVNFSLRDCIGDTMTSLSAQADAKGLELAYQIPSNVHDTLIGDPGRLRQIMINLLGNSIKFTGSGEVVLVVEPESEEDKQIALHFVVSDTGIGIPEDKRESIFKAFEQVDGSSSKHYPGTGLGLAIASQLVEMMDGSIWIESEVGKGSRFHFTARFGITSEAKRCPVAVSPVNLKDVRVLVVDDNGTNRRILEGILLGWNMVPTCVDGGASALASLAAADKSGEGFPLAIVDYMMPGMDGFELSARIRGNPDLAGTKIIMLTSAGQRGDAARCLTLGIAAYLLKPVKQSELLTAMSTALFPAERDAKPATLVTRHSIRESKRKLEILLAEDNPVNQKLASKLLQKMGHTVTIAANGREALSMLETRAFNMVLMDVQMPEMDGFEATHLIREMEKTTGGHLPIVAMTAHAMKGDRERCLDAGMDGYVSKPINQQELFEAIESFC
ncbi:MAG: response regulator [Pseudomonadota bacterium]